jgi:GNAT superfamily N-acetyltransferase
MAAKDSHCLASAASFETMTQSTISTSELQSALTVHLATDADKNSLNLLVNSAFSIESFLDGTRTDEQGLSAMMQKGAILIAEDAVGAPIGCVYAEIRGDRGYLGMLTVDPLRQRTGLGTRIMRAAEDYLQSQGCMAVDIAVLSLRTELPPIYRRCGYAETGTAPYNLDRTIRTGEDCHFIIMSKDLEPDRPNFL